MVKLLKTPVLLAAGALLSTGLLVFAQTMEEPGMAQPGAGQPHMNMAMPGTVNYIEGSANINGQPLTSGPQRSTRIAQGQTLATGMGSKAEILLSPGVVLRIGDNSAVRMVSPLLTNTQVALDHGTAMVEVDQIDSADHLIVIDNGANVRLEKKGLYSFNADQQPMVAVYDGRADVQIGDRSCNVDKGRELALQPGVKLKTESFNRNQEGELYAWSRLRSQYLAEANGYSAQTIMAYNPDWWYGTGWYWNPYFDSWAFVPGFGYGWGPFGYGFFSPGYVGYGGFYGHGVYGHGYYGRGYYSGHVGAFHGATGFRGGVAGGGFHGGGFAGGGFHGGGFGGGGRR